ncbi:hypothetical protein FA15DRAFT_685904 [Coprinopsis marcescibilis]|uniref:Uncharacterized protein n=1 Tax=Coprinopsis marcescibilis TaxID=230819 RepID=A0A5C3L3G0_COPMA|nr:hypothetical protein FA15DRAFT_685904 [Coprinopsis marcescibilis]
MSTEFNNLFALARNKLHVSFQKDSSLHRWVLLKNSILNSPTLVSHTVSEDEDDGADEALGSVAAHNFMFPNLLDAPKQQVHASEDQWLDSLLETLGDDDDDDYAADSETQMASSADDDEEQLFSPSVSPMSSLDDLPAVSYPVIAPYPPFHPAVSYAFAFVNSSLSSLPPPYEDPLPFSDDVDDMPVPDAIEDTSDDESDSPPTPSMAGSRSSLFSDDQVLDAASVPLPPDPSRLRHATPRVVFSQDPCFTHHLSFDNHPFPFSADDVHSTYNPYQEC